MSGPKKQSVDEEVSRQEHDLIDFPANRVNNYLQNIWRFAALLHLFTGGVSLCSEAISSPVPLDERVIDDRSTSENAKKFAPFT